MIDILQNVGYNVFIKIIYLTKNKGYLAVEYKDF